MELERVGNVFIVGHQAVLRCILGYFMETKNPEDVPYIKVMVLLPSYSYFH